MAERSVRFAKPSKPTPAFASSSRWGAMGRSARSRPACSRSAAKERVALGMLPTGTANDQGKSFGLEALPEALERNVEVIANGHETRLDVGV